MSTSPPSWLTWITTGIAFASFLWLITKHVLETQRSENVRRADLLDDYWFKSVIVPVCVSPLVEFLLDTAQKLDALKDTLHPSDSNNTTELNNRFDLFLNDFKKGNDTMRERFFFVVGQLDSGAYKTIAKNFDELDDDLTTYCAYRHLGPGKVRPEEYKRSESTSEVIFSKGGTILNTVLRLRIVKLGDQRFPKRENG